MENKSSKTLYILSLIAKGLLFAVVVPLFLFLLFTMYRTGYFLGFKDGQNKTEQYYLSIIEEAGLQVIDEISSEDSINEQPVIAAPPTKKQKITYSADWGGPELWEAVNERRQELGVNPLSQRDELCTIASIRLNELLTLGTLDNHEGFSNMSERRPDLAWIFDKYSTVAEFLALGGETAEETVSLWENTLGHKKLLTGGEYVWGCIYAQNTFAVAITAF